MKAMILRIASEDIMDFIEGKRTDFVIKNWPTLEPLSDVFIYCEKQGKKVFLDDTKTILNGKIVARGIYISARAFIPSLFTTDDYFWTWVGVPKEKVLKKLGKKDRGQLLRLQNIEKLTHPLDLKDFGINKMNNERRYVMTYE